MLFKVEYGHDLNELLKKMTMSINEDEIELIQYSICKEGLVFWLTYLYRKV